MSVCHCPQCEGHGPVDDGEAGWQECPDCHDCIPLGLACSTCDSLGGFYLGESMSKASYDRMNDNLRAEAASWEV
ncbi:hypothetical protein [Ramlibacter sp.]|uniref:hypothetical protein n=1 Tax=Ramlibacter sp. TaxID=1917967 RepID=UPI003D0E63E6